MKKCQNHRARLLTFGIFLLAMGSHQAAAQLAPDPKQTLRSHELDTFVASTEIKNNPYFQNGLRLGAKIGESHAGTLACAKEWVSTATEIDWTDPQSNPYLFGYYIAYSGAFEKARALTLLNCATSPEHQAISSDHYQRIHQVIQASMDALALQSCALPLAEPYPQGLALAPCSHVQLAAMPEEHRYWGTVILTVGREILQQLAATRRQLALNQREDMERRNTALISQIALLIRDKSLDAQKIQDIQAAAQALQSPESLPQFADFTVPYPKERQP